MNTLKHVQILTDAGRLESQYTEIWNSIHYVTLGDLME